jgi:AraC-like DNA-binding protein
MKEKQKTVGSTIDYIEKHLTEEIKLDDIAGAAGYSKYHLNRIFAEVTGQTIHKYIRERRLAESAVRLTSTDISIATIAQDAGYTSQQAYTLAFRQLYHDTPQAYREQNRIVLCLSRSRMGQATQMRHRRLFYNTCVKGGMAA